MFTLRFISSWFVIFIHNLEKFQKGFNKATFTNSDKQLLAILIMLHINSGISSIQFLPEKPEGAFLSSRVLIEPLEYAHYMKNDCQ